jgi:hypothetical protein
MSSDIKVTLGKNIKREAVLINPAISAADPVIASAADANASEPSNVIATGATTQEIMSTIHGR